MPRFYHDGNDQPLPSELQDMPLDLMRSHLYPRYPQVPAQAAEEQYGQPSPMYFPQRMLFSWGGRRNPGQNAVSAMTAVAEGQRVKRSAVVAAGVPEAVGTPVSYARGNGGMALQLDPVDPGVYEEEDPFPRGMPPAPTMTTADLDAIIQAEMDVRIGTRMTANDRTARAITQAELAATGVSRVVNPAVVPHWWKRY